jgi:transcriptional regulator with XRE-family HTH domain
MYLTMSATQYSTNAKAFAQRLKQLRMQKGLMQKEFAKSISINYTQYNRYEKGETIPSAEIFAKLADALNTTVDYLMEGKADDAVVANLADKELIQLFREIEIFTPEEKEHVKFVLNGLVKTKKHEALSAKAS